MGQIARGTMVESERRKPGVDLESCVAVHFGDGQLWHVPKPRLRIAPGWDGTKCDLVYSATYGQPADALIVTAAQAEDDGVRLAAVATLAALLLRQTYDLADGELDQILALEEPHWMREIIMVGTGHFGIQRIRPRERQHVR
jgi:hypothetical protein